jgi:hypothetical protein
MGSELDARDQRGAWMRWCLRRAGIPFAVVMTAWSAYDVLTSGAAPRSMAIRLGVALVLAVPMAYLFAWLLGGLMWGIGFGRSLPRDE